MKDDATSVEGEVLIQRLNRGVVALLPGLHDLLQGPVEPRDVGVVVFVVV